MTTMDPGDRTYQHVSSLGLSACKYICLQWFVCMSCCTLHLSHELMKSTRRSCVWVLTGAAMAALQSSRAVRGEVPCLRHICGSTASLLRTQGPAVGIVCGARKSRK